MDSYRTMAIAYHIVVLSPAICLSALPFAFLLADVFRQWRRRG